MLKKEKVLKKLERIMVAVTFAEANLHEESVNILNEDKEKRVEKGIRIEKKQQRPQIRL